MAGEVHVRGEHGGAGGGDRVVEGKVGEQREEVRVGCGDAGGVVEGGDGTDGDRGGGGVGACVVLWVC